MTADKINSTKIDSTREGRAVLRSLVALQWDGCDLQASALMPLFGICETLYVFGETVPEECEFRPSPMLGSPEDVSDWPGTEIVDMYLSYEVRTGDLQYWARVLARYTDLIPEDERY